MSDIKKLLTIFNESTTAGSVAVGAGRGKLPADTIFAAEDSDCSSIEMPNSPANFDLWKNSKLIGKQQNSHKKVAVNKTTMYPQLAEGTHPEQEKINNTKRSRLSRERNAGLNEPDEVPSSDVKRDFGTWYFTYQDGSIVIKDGRPLLASSTQGVRDVIAIAKKHGIDVRSHEGAPPKLSESGYKTPKDMDDYTDDDWAEWDAKVGNVGEKAKKKDNLDWHYNNIMGTKGLSDKAKKQTTDIYNKLKENEGVAEGIGSDMAKLIGVPVVAGAAAIGAQYYDDQQPHVQVGGQNAKIVRADSNRIPDNAMILTGKDGKQYRVWQQSGKGMSKITFAAPVQGTNEGVAEGLSKGNYNVGLEDIGKPVTVDGESGYVLLSIGYSSGNGKLTAHILQPDTGSKGTYDLETIGKGQQDVAEGSQPNDIAVYHHTGPNADKKAQVHAMKLGSDYGHFRHDKADKNDNLHIVTQKRYFPDYAKQQDVAEGLEDKVVFQGHTIGHIETDSDGDSVGIVYSNNPQSKRPFEIFGYEDVNQLKQEMISQWNKRVPKGTAKGQELSEEMIADRLKNELALFKKGTKAKDKDLGSKPKSKEVQPKKSKESKDEDK